MAPQEQDLGDLRAVLVAAGIDADIESAERLPSASNVVYAVGDRVVRVGTRPRAGVDTRNEVTNMRLAAERGLAPEVVAWSETGWLVTQRLPGAALRAVDGADLVEAVAQLLRDVHEGAGFVGVHDPWRMSGLLAAGGATNSTCDELAAVLEGCRFAPGASTPCHGDPWPGNVVVAGGERPRLRLVDWEYSGMGDPLWDVADFAVECDLDESTEHRLLAAYLGRVPDASTLHRVRTYRCLSDLLWARWSLQEHAAGNDADDFVAEAARRSERGLTASTRLRIDGP